MSEPASRPDNTSPADKGPQPDNTKVNERDRDSATLTPMDQGNGESDLKLTQAVRQAVMADKALSFTAKNVKIITKDGKITLRGPVKTAEERAAIEADARKAAGAAPIDNQIEVKK
ncbi:MAG TPA: BON domain-containing protein [Polyangiaceae bacterium]|nr:BON domain-containing protein [Polyangiaceae bacterium]